MRQRVLPGKERRHAAIEQELHQPAPAPLGCALRRSTSQLDGEPVVRQTRRRVRRGRGRCSSPGHYRTGHCRRRVGAAATIGADERALPFSALRRRRRGLARAGSARAHRPRGRRPDRAARRRARARRLARRACSSTCTAGSRSACWSSCRTRPTAARTISTQVASGVAWEIWFTPKQTFKIETTAQHSPLQSLNFATLRIKDAIADRFRAKAGGVRPSIETQWPDVRVFAHLTTDTCTLYIDTTRRAAVQARLAHRTRATRRSRKPWPPPCSRPAAGGTPRPARCRSCRCTTPAAAAAPSPSRPRRSRAACAAGVAAALRLREAAAVPAARVVGAAGRGAQRGRAGGGAGGVRLRRLAPHGRLRRAQRRARGRGRSGRSSAAATRCSACRRPSAA